MMAVNTILEVGKEQIIIWLVEIWPNLEVFHGGYSFYPPYLLEQYKYSVAYS